MMNDVIEGLAISALDLLALQLRGLGVLVLTVLLGALLRRSSASVRHCLWRYGLAAVVALPILTALLPIVVGAANGAAPAPYATVPSPSLAVLNPEWFLPEESGDPGGWTALSSLAMGLCVAIWLLGAVLIAGKTLLSMVGFAVLRVRARAPGGALARRLAELNPPIDLPVAVSDDVSTPVVGGWLRPCILLPTAFQAVALGRLQLVLAHERAHVRHGDHRWVIVAAFARAMCWPNPLVWLASAQLRKSAECAADDAVLATGVRPSEYAAELLAWAYALAGRRSPAIAPAIITRGGLASRMAALLRDGQRRAPVALTLAVPLAVGSLGAAASLAMIEVCDGSKGCLGSEPLEVPAPVVDVPLSPGTSGDVSHEVLRYTLAERTRILQRCIDRSGMIESELVGTLQYTISINSLGSVTSVSPGESTIRSAALDACAREEIQRWRFAGAGEVTFMVKFSADETL